MSYPVYSTRFVVASGKAGVTSYWVPAGFRAVLKDVEIVHPAAVATDFTVYVAGNFAAFFRFPDGRTYQQQSLMCVAYAGEDISCHQFRNDTGMMLSGFLMREQGLVRDAPPTTSSSLDEYLQVVEEKPAPKLAELGP